MTGRITRLFQRLTAVLLMILMFTPFAFAEGSLELNKKDTSGGYRPYLEYYAPGLSTSETANLLRRTEIYAYLREGETACFGSSAIGTGVIEVLDHSGVSTT